jgi:hypothetical protein
MRQVNVLGSSFIQHVTPYSMQRHAGNLWDFLLWLKEASMSMLDKHALMILGKQPSLHFLLLAFLHHLTAASSSSSQLYLGRCANVIPVIKAGLQSLQLPEAGQEEVLFVSYLIKTGTYIAAELLSLFQECASAIQQHQQHFAPLDFEDQVGREISGVRDIVGESSSVAPFISE